MRAWRPEVVYHLAAQASVPLLHRIRCATSPSTSIGTHRVARRGPRRGRPAARLRLVGRRDLRRDTARPRPKRHIPAPTSYYGIHKLAAEGHVAISGLPYAIARPSNIYGPRQARGLEGAVVAAFVGQALARQPLTIDGDGGQTRDFVHVRDVVDALVRLGTRATPIGTWNVASGRRVSITALADTVERASGGQLGREWRPERVGDVRDSAISATRLRALGWKPAVSLSRGLRELIAGPNESSGRRD